MKSTDANRDEEKMATAAYGISVLFSSCRLSIIHGTNYKRWYQRLESILILCACTEHGRKPGRSNFVPNLHHHTTNITVLHPLFLQHKNRYTYVIPTSIRRGRLQHTVIQPRTSSSSFSDAGGDNVFRNAPFAALAGAIGLGSVGVTYAA